MTQKEKKIILDRLETALYQAFQYKKRKAPDILIQETAFHAENLISLCRDLGLNKEIELTYKYVNRLVFKR